MVKFVFKVKIAIVHSKENYTYLYRETQKFWIPYDLVDDGEGVASLS